MYVIKCVLSLEATCPLNTPMEDLKIKRFPEIKGSVKPGHRLIFSCNGQGLILKGQREITCQSNGEWSSPFPKCEVKATECDALDWTNIDLLFISLDT